ncbi:malate dehydrogenase (quinone) [Blochmannia endosymbiont of Polyrhachis (Hedomyrma) turneri]|uniref:malate dehydrogenase (quinone) n=1 Tax=Blochmannia endosymbiont of Polyrhachis (Hedomyrma) turneri TaxID=1505596 RepID=UPI00061A817E|nr:malate dehydrogenase (quinone) [Blochmannia endosymbiont of Polyrhachis (Hedomyrma) turneri]AKC60088.1 Malate:quinone oxidoreductase [Blochmannia endosymbiont of Polyrhachis (Hedomyrma) turneri]
MKYLTPYKKNNNKKTHYQTTPIDIVLIGAGIMSASLATVIKILEPSWNIHMYERLKKVGQESSNAWNNAGTGHAAFCELNYTKQNENGIIDISKAIQINEAFEISRQFWAYLVKNQFLNNPHSFINNISHMSFVWGENNIKFLRKRFHALQNNTLFYGINYSEDPKKIHEWAPLLMEGRDPYQKIAATHIETGTDINFGEITQQLITTLKTYPNFYIYLKHNVNKIRQNKNHTWLVNITDHNQQNKNILARYVFVGAGGQSLPLLQSTGIQEINGYAGFPVGGQFLFTNNPKITNKHSAKIYGQSPINTPPMSVPHIDTRIIDGQRILLFGPFATFSGKFLKHGSQSDIIRSLTYHNLLPILEVGINNFQLIKYLIQQLKMPQEKKFNQLLQYYPNAKINDWTLLNAGQRVQIIKKNNNNRGILQFGTEIVSSSTGTLSALLGASPGASTTACIILEILHIMFKEHINSTSWTNTINDIIPSYNHTLNGNIPLINKIRNYICKTLQLKNITIIPKNNIHQYNTDN